MLDQLPLPIIQAPMAGGPSTPELAAAVSEAGGLGFLAAGYRSVDDVRAQIQATRALTDAPFGVNLFVPGAHHAPIAVVQAFAGRILPRAEAAGVELGKPRWDDDDYAAKLAVLLEQRPAVASFAFGLPAPDEIAALQAAGIAVWVTITDRAEAEAAQAAGAGAVIAQGAEAGGHRGSFTDHDEDPLPLLDLLATLPDDLPAIAAGGLMDGDDIASALGAGATAAQLGTAFLRCPEAGTSAVHREALLTDEPTMLTRAFSGRRARGIANAWAKDFSVDAPKAYPELAHLTAPLRAHGVATNTPELVNLWAGTGHTRTRTLPAAELIHQLADELSAVGGG